jgi:DNA-binding NarL/FixJ family response regulator
LEGSFRTAGGLSPDPLDDREEPGRLPRILLVDDHRLFAEAVRSALANAGFDIVEVVSNGERALDAVESHRPDLVLLDLNIPRFDGVDLGALMLSRHPELRLIMVTGYSDTSALRRAMRAGFHGFISKDASMSEFVAAVRAVATGSVVVPIRLADRIAIARSDEEQMAALQAQQLTPREWKVLQLLVEGATTARIAQDLSISVNTVRTHVQSVLSKLQVGSRLEAVAYTIRNHLMEGTKGA